MHFFALHGNEGGFYLLACLSWVTFLLSTFLNEQRHSFSFVCADLSRHKEHTSTSRDDCLLKKAILVCSWLRLPIESTYFWLSNLNVLITMNPDFIQFRLIKDNVKIVSAQKIIGIRWMCADTRSTFIETKITETPKILWYFRILYAIKTSVVQGERFPKTWFIAQVSIMQRIIAKYNVSWETLSVLWYNQS